MDRDCRELAREKSIFIAYMFQFDQEWIELIKENSASSNQNTSVGVWSAMCCI